MLSILNLILFVFITKCALAKAPIEILILINGQNSTEYHRQLQHNLYNDLRIQSQQLDSNFIINVQLLNDLFKHPGDWTILYALPKLFDTNNKVKNGIIKSQTKWIVLCEDNTKINIKELVSNLKKEDFKKPKFFGYPLYDAEATIIHHFAFFKDPSWFPYPLLRSGVIFSATLLERIAFSIRQSTIQMKSAIATEFNIDVSYELARFIYDQYSSKEAALEAPRALGQAVLLKKTPYICLGIQTDSTNIYNSTLKINKLRRECSLVAQISDEAKCTPVSRQQVFFAIKTFHKFHTERIPIIEATWAKWAIHKRYYSDLADPSLQIINTGIPNSDTGHCEKTLKILQLALNDIQKINNENKVNLIEWLVLTDDDTLLSIPRLSALLGCFSPVENIYLGERYGYRLYAEDGFNYITGGGGIVFSIPVVKEIISNCQCPSDTAPDDMVLGACLKSLNIMPTHSPQFHQARANDYSLELLQLDPPISFHKFWQLDPIDAYRKWFAADDNHMLKTSVNEGCAGESESDNYVWKGKKNSVDGNGVDFENQECKCIANSKLHSKSFSFKQFLMSNNNSCIPALR